MKNITGKATKKHATIGLISAILLGLLLIPVAAKADNNDDEAPPSGRSAGSRGCGTIAPQVRSDVSTPLLLLTPPGRAKTVATRPTFAWFVRDDISVLMEFRLYLKEKNNRYKAIAQIKDDSLKTSPGINVLSLPQTTPELAKGRYRWQVVLVCDPSHPSSNLFAEAELEVVPLPPALKTQLAKTSDPLDRALLYQQAGFWYDALEMAIASDSNHSGLKDRRLTLFDKVTLNNIERQILQNSAVHFKQR
jgi:hypothetical protein